MAWTHHSPGPRRTPLSTTIAAETPRPGRFAGVHPLLFGAYAVLFLWSQNLGETNPRQVLLPLIAVVAGAAVVTIVLGLVLRDRRRGALVASAFLVTLLMYGHAAHILGAVHVPTLVQRVAWVGLIVVALVAAVRLSDRSILALDTALDRIAALLVLVTLVLILPWQSRAFATRASLPQLPVAATETTAETRDVYWLIFDRYGSDRALSLRYGVDNDLPEWLEGRGFTVLPDSHANYIRTVLSLSTTLQMAHLDALAAAQGAESEDLTAVDERLQDPLVARQFKALGYRYDHIGGAWDPTRADDGADANFNVSTWPTDFLDALFDASAVAGLERVLDRGEAPDRKRQFTYSTYGLDAIEDLRDAPGPKFVMAHVLLPHPPLVFKADGSFLTEKDAHGLTGQQVYEGQLAFTNTRIREIVDGLLALPEAQRPIIIIQADEGPWPLSYGTGRNTSPDWAATAPDKELEEKYGIINAWYVPGGTAGLGLYPSMSAINTFPVLFSRYFGIDYPLLADRSYSSRDWAHPYDLTDITHRLQTGP